MDSRPTRRGTIPYRPEVDGLRAVAVVPVLSFHAELGCSGGYVGVDVFFVISGFLIGSLVIAEISAGTFSLVQFWERRVRRIFPALAVVVLATFAAAWIWMVPQPLERVAKSVLAQPLLVSNFHFWKQSGYFAPAAEDQPLLHTWSLAVEEQFYLLFPLVMLLLMKWGKRATWNGILTFVAVSLGWSLWAAERYPASSFFLPPARIWELDLGVLLALASDRRSVGPRLGNALGWLGIAAIGTAIFAFDVNTVFPGAAALLPCLGAAAIIHGNGGGRTGVGRVLAWRPFTFVGRISYSLYLWHWPLLVFVDYLEPGEVTRAERALVLAASCALAAASWRWVETPFRRKRILPGRRPLFAFAGVTGAALVAGGWITYEGEGFPSRFPPHVAKHARVSTRYDDWHGVLNRLAKTGSLPTTGAEPSRASGQLLLWGDSHAMSLLPAFERMGERTGVAVHGAVQPGIAPVAGAWSVGETGAAAHFGEEVLAYLERNRIRHVVLAARWSVYVYGDPRGERHRLLRDAGGDTSSAERARSVFVEALRGTLRELHEMGAKVWLLRDVGLQPSNVPATLALAAKRGLDLNAYARPLRHQREEERAINPLIDEAVGDLDVAVLNPLPHFTDETGLYLMARDGKALYNDNHHLSPFGAHQLAPLLRPAFESARDSSDENGTPVRGRGAGPETARDGDRPPASAE